MSAPKTLKQLQLPPSGTPAYDALAEIGGAVIYKLPIYRLVKTYYREFLGEEESRRD